MLPKVHLVLGEEDPNYGDICMCIQHMWKFFYIYDVRSSSSLWFSDYGVNPDFPYVFMKVGYRWEKKWFKEMKVSSCQSHCIKASDLFWIKYSKLDCENLVWVILNKAN